jgi:hypothetical protein
MPAMSGDAVLGSAHITNCTNVMSFCNVHEGNTVMSR